MELGLSGLLSFFGRREAPQEEPVRPIQRVISAVTIRPGDDLILSVVEWDTSENLVDLLCAAQKQFPGVRIHLLAGVGQAQVAPHCGEHCRRKGYDGPDDHGREPRLPIPLPFGERFAGLTNPTTEGKVYVNHCSVGRVVLVSVPPKQQGDSVFEVHGATGVGTGAER